MKKKVTKLMMFALVLAIALMSPITAFAESSSRVGEYVPFNSGGVADGGGGASNSNTLTERERQANSTNSSASRQIREKVGTLINTYTEDNGYLLWQDGGYTFITEQTITADELRWLIDSAGMFDPIGSGYSVPVYTPHTPNLNAGDRSGLRSLVSSLMGGSGSTNELEIPSVTNPLWNANHIRWTDWKKNGFGSLDEFIEWLIQQGGHHIRVDLDGGFIDFPNVQTRYEMLDQYLNATSSTDTIKMQYVLEYRIENTAHNTTYRMVGQNGMNSYSWNFKNQSTGEAYNRYNQPSAIYHQFMRVGAYEIDVSKDVYKTYCDAFTFSVNEYWLVEETGQVVWKSETVGKDIDPTVPALELGLRNLVMYNTPDPTEMPSVETIAVADIRHVVTEDMLNQSIPAESSFREFFTERIQ